MSIESGVFDLLRGLVGGRVFPDVAPVGTARPYITYQQIGGQAVNFVDDTSPNLENAFLQINCFADARNDANTLARSVETTLRGATAFSARPEANFISTHDADLNRYGTLQDFSVWAAR